MEIHDPSVTPQQRATLIGTLLMMDYMFFERDIDMCGRACHPSLATSSQACEPWCLDVLATSLHALSLCVLS
jgi:hypothetical protein